MALGALGLGLLWASTSSAKAKPKGGGGPSPADVKAKGEADWAQTQVAIAVAQCKDPMTCNIGLLRSTAQKLRGHQYSNAEVEAQAMQAADDLTAMAQDAEDYQNASAGGNHVVGGPGGSGAPIDQSAFDAALGPLG